MEIYFRSRVFQGKLRASFEFKELGPDDIQNLGTNPPGEKCRAVVEMVEELAANGDIQPSSFNELQETLAYPGEIMYVTGGSYRLRDDDAMRGMVGRLRAIFPGIPLEEDVA